MFSLDLGLFKLSVEATVTLIIALTGGLFLLGTSYLRVLRKVIQAVMGGGIAAIVFIAALGHVEVLQPLAVGFLALAVYLALIYAICMLIDNAKNEQ